MGTRVRARWFVALLAVVGLVVAAAACTDDDDGGDASDDSTGSQSEAAASELTGDPLTVYVIEDSSESAGVTFPNLRAGVEARVSRINGDGGGLGGSGRPVEVEYCVTDFDANAAADCAREAAADEDAIAVAASVSANGDVVLPILEEAGLASVGSTAFSVEDGSNPISFPVMGGLFAGTGCQATLLVDEDDASAIAVAYADTPGADQAVALVDAVLAPSGLSVENEVVTPVAQPDYSAELNAVTADADGLVLATDGATAQKIVQQLAQLGIDVPTVGSGAQGWTPSVLESLDGAADGLNVAAWFATDDMPGEGVQAYLDDLEAVDASDQSDDLAKLGWTSFELLDQTAAGLDEIDRETVLAGLQATSAFDSGGMTPVLDFTEDGTLIAGPRFVNDSCVYAQVDGTEVVARSDGFVYPLSES